MIHIASRSKGDARISLPILKALEDIDIIDSLMKLERGEPFP